MKLSSGPVIDNDKIIVGSIDAEVAAYAGADGNLLWKTSLSSEVIALPAVSKGVVIVRGSDGRITGLDDKNGSTLWSHERTAPPLAVRSKGGPAIAGDLAIDGYGGGKLLALRIKDGQTEWEAVVALAKGRSEIDRLLDINATPVIKGDMIYVSGYQGGVAAVSLNNGEVQWRQEKFFSHSGLTSNRRSLFLTDASSDVWRLDMRNGSDLWKQDELHQRRLTPPVPVKDKLVVGDLRDMCTCCLRKMADCWPECKWTTPRYNPRPSFSMISFMPIPLGANSPPSPWNEHAACCRSGGPPQCGQIDTV